MDLYLSDYPESGHYYLYASTGKIVEIYANGYKKKAVVGKMYSPATLEPDYSIDVGVTHYGSSDVNYYHFSTEADYFAYASIVAENNSNPTYTYYRDKTYTRGSSSIIAAPAYYEHVDNSEMIQFVNYESCSGNNSSLYCRIAHPETGEAMTNKEVQEMLDDDWASAYVYIHDLSKF